MARGHKYIVIHHFGVPAKLSAQEWLLSMTRTYVKNTGDIVPTHYIIGREGDFVKANSLDKIVGATLDADANANGIHIELVWDFNSYEPNEKQYDMLKTLIGWIKQKYPKIEVKYHQDFQQKNCPGVYFNRKFLDPVVMIPHANWANRPVFIPKWKTKDERFSRFASRYWFGASMFSNPHWVKPEFLLCIAFAEWFWKNSGSSGNIMNCGNNDRRDRISFENINDSIMCASNKIANWLLKNKFQLWDYSYAGNCKRDCQYIYASSKWPREINIRNCLSAIYGRPIWADFITKL